MPASARLTICVDPDAAMLAEAKVLAPDGVLLCPAIDQMPPDAFDAAIVAVPNHLHRTVCESLLSRFDVHILCEKPLATTMEDCERIARCLRPNKLFAVGLEYRHIPPMRKLLDELPTIGPLKMLSIREHRFPFLAKVGGWNRTNATSGGTLVEKGCHFFDFMALCCGEQRRPTTVYARGGQAVNHLTTADVVDHAVVIVDFEDVVCTLDLCMFAEASAHQLEVCAVGVRGKLEAFAPAHGVKTDDDAEPNFHSGIRQARDWEASRDAPHQSHTKDAVVKSKVPLDTKLMAVGDHAGATYYELVEFAEAASTNQPHNLASVHDAAQSVAIGLAAQLSMSTRRAVDLADVLPDFFKPRHPADSFDTRLSEEG